MDEQKSQQLQVQAVEPPTVEVIVLGILAALIMVLAMPLLSAANNSSTSQTTENAQIQE